MGRAATGTLPSERAMVGSLERVMRAADSDARAAGASWYPREGTAVAAMAERYGVSVSVAAGVTAALSPRMQWSANKRAAETVIRAYVRGGRRPRVGMRANVSKAWRVLSGERPSAVLGGPKVRAFYANLRGYGYAVTVDAWAMRAAGVRGRDTLTARQYAAVAAAYRKAARAAGMRPCDFQAVAWVAVRGRAA